MSKRKPVAKSRKQKGLKARPAQPTERIRTTKKARFLRAVTKVGGGVLEAARVAKIHKATHSEWMKSDPLYPAEFAEACELGTQNMERIAVERANRKSDLLMIFMLKARRPEVYRELRQEHHHTGEIGAIFDGLYGPAAALEAVSTNGHAGNGREPAHR